MSKKRTLLLTAAYTACTLVLTAQQLKAGPRTSQAYKELNGRQPNAWEVQIKLCNDTRKDFNQLKQYIKDDQASLSSKSL